MKRRDLLRHLSQHGCQFCVKVENIQFGRTQLQSVAPRCHVIRKSLITLQGESAGRLASLYHFESLERQVEAAVDGNVLNSDFDRVGPLSNVIL